MPTDAVTLLGAGGHAKVVYDAILAAKIAARVIVRDDDLELRGAPFIDTQVVAPIGDLRALDGLIHIGIGANRVRAELAGKIAAAGKRLLSVIHPAASVSARSVVGEGAFVAARAIIAASASIGECAIINHGAIVDHDCVIGRCVHLAPGAILGGGVKLGEGAVVGAGAVVLPGVSIGKWAVVGAGAVVNRTVPERETVYGVPAKRKSDA
jgi:sugar O-acyltransferase (sialic acid O-acetyltransferase NeuD family)